MNILNLISPGHSTHDLRITIFKQGMFRKYKAVDVEFIDENGCKPQGPSGEKSRVQIGLLALGWKIPGDSGSEV